MTDRTEHTYMDRSAFEKGEWDNEPDFVYWTDPYTQYKCLIRRSIVGVLCGYVGVEKGHPCYGMDYLSVPVEMHGGITFSDHIDGYPIDGYPIGDKLMNWAIEWGKENSKTWWIGFDCCHYGDLMPLKEGYIEASIPKLITYKNINFVTKEVESLARQLKNM